jgi:phosphoglycolate phosphatase
LGRIKGLVFDKDGTLFDFRATWSAWTRRLLAGLAGGDPDREAVLGDTIGFDLAAGTFRPDSPVIAHQTPEIAAILLPHLPGWEIGALVGHMNRLSAEARVAPAVPLRPLFTRLRGMGLSVGLCTNDAEEPARAHLAQVGVLDFFDIVTGFDSGHGAKPDPGPILACARAFGALPDAVAMVGDSRHDLVAGRAAGAVTVGVLTGLALHGDLAPLADAVLPDIGHLPAWLARLDAA